MLASRSPACALRTTPLLILMGVAGSGKTTIGRAVAGQLGWCFVDADDLQEAAHVSKLSSGRRLNDQERNSWLIQVRTAVRGLLESEASGVVAFPALRRTDRVLVIGDDPRIQLVYLRAPVEVLKARVQARQHPFFNPRLLDSEFSILEEPLDALVVDATKTPEQITSRILSFLREERKKDPWG